MIIEDPQFVAQFEGWGARYRPDEMLSEHTSLGVGGPADLIDIERPKALEPIALGLERRGIAWRLLGGGTNVLAADEPHRRVYLRLARPPQAMEFLDDMVRISAAADLGRSVMECAKRNFGGMEGLVGVPGSVGGALRMNAGAYGTEIGPFVRSITVFRGSLGRTEELAAGDVGFKYRKSSFAPDDVMLDVTLTLKPRPFREILDHVKQLNLRRRGSQPLKEKSAGCIFKNPPGLSTGKMIDELGMKGTRVGGVVVSERHANFLVNRYDARAADFFRMMDLIRERVLRGYGVELEEEVIVWKN
jgi:UDP-N-acetylmuramate dehydrogenase